MLIYITVKKYQKNINIWKTSAADIMIWFSPTDLSFWMYFFHEKCSINFILPLIGTWKYITTQIVEVIALNLNLNSPTQEIPFLGTLCHKCIFIKTSLKLHTSILKSLCVTYNFFFNHIRFDTLPWCLHIIANDIKINYCK